MDLDENHFRMIDLLRRDGRLSVAALAEKLGISRSNAHARFEALRREGIITGFHAAVDPAKVNAGIAAMVFIALDQTKWQEFMEHLPHVPQLDYFAVTTGEYDAMLLVRTPDVGSLNYFVVNELSQWSSVKDTTTVFLMDEGYHQFSIGPALEEITNSLDDTSQPRTSLGMMRFTRIPNRRVENLTELKPGT